MTDRKPSPPLARIRDLLEQAWERPEADRPDWLVAHCEDPVLLAEVESLLCADAEATDFLGGDAGTLAAQLLESGGGPAESVQQRIDRYRIVRRIARGGMGDVYLAERAEATFEQVVALKLAHRFSDTLDRRRRFLDEQQILARLEHPNIARLIDGGIWDGDVLAEGGRPYLVMEFVDGLPITAYCERLGLELRERLDLFRIVCDAVHYAHRNLVIHRDLKPSNILVAEGGQVKLLDFGIATMLAEDNAIAATGTLLMTREYAAPEQVRGEPLTTSTDVYALGLLLYELVSGRRVYNFQDASPTEVERQVCLTEPDPPSRVAQSEGQVPWARRLHSDLDTVVLKALQKAPERRYPSARALAADVENFLKRRPVEARPDRWTYRLAKFVSRHRWQTLSAAVGLVLLVTAAIVSSVSATRATNALQQVRTESQKTEQVVDFLRELFAAADPQQTSGEPRSVRDVLEIGTQRIDALDGQPEVQALLLSELGQIHTSLGNFETATESLERAAGLQRAVLGPTHPALAETLHRSSIAEDVRGDLDRAEQHAREALAIRQAALPANHPGIGESLDRLGAVIGGAGRYEEAEPLMAEAVRHLLATAGEEDNRTLTALHNLAWLQGRLGRHAESEASYRKVIELASRHGTPNDPELLVSRDSLAIVLRRQGKLDEAEAIYRDVLDRRRQILGENHHTVGVTMHNLARLLSERGAHAEAEVWFRQALGNWRNSLAPDHPHNGIGLSNLGRVLEAQGDIGRAEANYRESIGILHGHRPNYDRRLAEVLLRLGRLLTENGRPGDGRPVLADAAAIRASESMSDLAMAEVDLELGNCLLHLGEEATAKDLIERAAAVIQSSDAADPSQVARAGLVKERQKVGDQTRNP